MAVTPSTPPETLDAKQQRLVEEYLPLVHRIASRWRACRRQQIEHGDLVQIGALGLMEAARRFDPAREGSFGAYARARIAGSIRDALRQYDPLSRDARQGVKELERMRRELRFALGREPSVDELAGRLGWTAEAVRRRQADVGALKDGLAQTMAEPVDLPSKPAPGRSEGEAQQSVLQGEFTRAMGVAIATLPARHQAVLALYYQVGLTMRDVGHLLGVTESRVCQVHGAALGTLRTRLAALAGRTQAA